MQELSGTKPSPSKGMMIKSKENAKNDADPIFIMISHGKFTTLCYSNIKFIPMAFQDLHWHYYFSNLQRKIHFILDNKTLSATVLGTQYSWQSSDISFLN